MGLAAAAGIGAVATIGSTVLGASASKKAAKAQAAATDKGIAEEHRQFDLTRSDLAPWREAGGKAIGQGYAMLQPGYDYTTSPGYQFRFGEGQRAVESSAASKGMLMSGGTLKDLVRFGQGTAAQDYNDQFNRTMAVASGGQQAATSGAQLGQQSANSIADLYTQGGNAKASGYIGQANAISGGLGQLAQLGGMFFSDEALKENIEELGRDIGGVPAIAFEYRRNTGLDLPEGRFEGVRAQDVAQLRPDALGPRIAGYLTVDYGALYAH